MHLACKRKVVGKRPDAKLVTVPLSGHGADTALPTTAGGGYEVFPPGTGLLDTAQDSSDTKAGRQRSPPPAQAFLPDLFPDGSLQHVPADAHNRVGALTPRPPQGPPAPAADAAPPQQHTTPGHRPRQPPHHRGVQRKIQRLVPVNVARQQQAALRTTAAEPTQGATARTTAHHTHTHTQLSSVVKADPKGEKVQTATWVDNVVRVLSTELALLDTQRVTRPVTTLDEALGVLERVGGGAGAAYGVGEDPLAALPVCEQRFKMFKSCFEGLMDGSATYAPLLQFWGKEYERYNTALQQVVMMLKQQVTGLLERQSRQLSLSGHSPSSCERSSVYPGSVRAALTGQFQTDKDGATPLSPGVGDASAFMFIDHDELPVYSFGERDLHKEESRIMFAELATRSPLIAAEAKAKVRFDERVQSIASGKAGFARPPQLVSVVQPATDASGGDDLYQKIEDLTAQLAGVRAELETTRASLAEATAKLEGRADAADGGDGGNAVTRNGSGGGGPAALRTAARKMSTFPAAARRMSLATDSRTTLRENEELLRRLEEAQQKNLALQESLEETKREQFQVFKNLVHTSKQKQDRKPVPTANVGTQACVDTCEVGTVPAAAVVVGRGKSGSMAAVAVSALARRQSRRVVDGDEGGGAVSVTAAATLLGSSGAGGKKPAAPAAGGGDLVADAGTASPSPSRRGSRSRGSISRGTGRRQALDRTPSSSPVTGDLRAGRLALDPGVTVGTQTATKHYLREVCEHHNRGPRARKRKNAYGDDILSISPAAAFRPVSLPREQPGLLDVIGHLPGGGDPAAAGPASGNGHEPHTPATLALMVRHIDSDNSDSESPPTNELPPARSPQPQALSPDVQRRMQNPAFHSHNAINDVLWGSLGDIRTLFGGVYSIRDMKVLRNDSNVAANRQLETLGPATPLPADASPLLRSVGYLATAQLGVGYVWAFRVDVGDCTGSGAGRPWTPLPARAAAAMEAFYRDTVDGGDGACGFVLPPQIAGALGTEHVESVRFAAAATTSWGLQSFTASLPTDGGGGGADDAAVPTGATFVSIMDGQQTDTVPGFDSRERNGSLTSTVGNVADALLDATKKKSSLRQFAKTMSATLQMQPPQVTLVRYENPKTGSFFHDSVLWAYDDLPAREWAPPDVLEYVHAHGHAHGISKVSKHWAVHPLRDGELGGVARRCEAWDGTERQRHQLLRMAKTYFAAKSSTLVGSTPEVGFAGSIGVPRADVLRLVYTALHVEATGVVPSGTGEGTTIPEDTHPSSLAKALQLQVMVTQEGFGCQEGMAGVGRRGSFNRRSSFGRRSKSRQGSMLRRGSSSSETLRAAGGGTSNLRSDGSNVVVLMLSPIVPDTFFVLNTGTGVVHTLKRMIHPHPHQPLDVLNGVLRDQTPYVEVTDTRHPWAGRYTCVNPTATKPSSLLFVERSSEDVERQLRFNGDGFTAVEVQKKRRAVVKGTNNTGGVPPMQLEVTAPASATSPVSHGTPDGGDWATAAGGNGDTILAGPVDIPRTDVRVRTGRWGAHSVDVLHYAFHTCITDVAAAQLQYRKAKEHTGAAVVYKKLDDTQVPAVNGFVDGDTVRAEGYSLWTSDASWVQHRHLEDRSDAPKAGCAGDDGGGLVQARVVSAVDLTNHSRYPRTATQLVPPVVFRVERSRTVPVYAVELEELGEVLAAQVALRKLVSDADSDVSPEEAAVFLNAWRACAAGTPVNALDALLGGVDLPAPEPRVRLHPSNHHLLAVVRQLTHIAAAPTLLHRRLAVATADDDVAFLVRAGADPFHVVHDPMTNSTEHLVTLACRLGHFNKARLMLEQVSRLPCAPESFTKAEHVKTLDHAIRVGGDNAIDVLKAVLMLRVEWTSEVADVANAVLDDEQATPLHRCAGVRAAAAASMLIEHGANCRRRDLAARTPLDNAVAALDFRMTALLLPFFEMQLQKSDFPADALHRAARHGLMSAVGPLIELGFEPQDINEDGLTAMQVAETHGHSEIFLMLKPFTMTAAAQSLAAIAEGPDGAEEPNV